MMDFADDIWKYMVIAVVLVIVLYVAILGSKWYNSRQGEPVDASVQVIDTYEKTSTVLAGKAVISQHHYYVVVEYKGNSYTIDSRQVFDAYQEDQNIKVRGIIRIKDDKVIDIDSLYLEAD